MEDILASIRRIIAEEPTAKPVSPPPPPAQVALEVKPAPATTVQAPAYQQQPSQPAVVVTTVGLPQGYTPAQPEPTTARTSLAAGLPLPSFPQSRQRAPSPTVLSPRIVEAARQQPAPVAPQPPAPVNATPPAPLIPPAGTLAARLNDVFGSGPATRQPEQAWLAPQYGVQTVKTALDADLADLMDDADPAPLIEAVLAMPVTPAPVAPPLAVESVMANAAQPTSVAQPPVAAAPSPPTPSPNPNVVAPLVLSPHPLPLWLNHAPALPTHEVVPPPPSVHVAPVVQPITQSAPVLTESAPVEFAPPPKPKPAPVVIAAMSAAPRPAPVVTVPALAAPEPAAPALLSITDVLPTRDVSIAWVPNAPVEAVEPEHTAPRVHPIEPPVSVIEPQADAAVASALGALAAGLAASRVSVAPEIVVAPPAPVAEIMPVLDRLETPKDDDAQRLTPSQAVATQDALGVDAALEPVYPHDDTAVELLRPMLRHWLDSNMPRIVEKALRAELAANPPPTKPDSNV